MSKPIDISQQREKKRQAAEKKPPANVVELSNRRKEKSPLDNPIVRLAPELDGLEMLYSNDVNKDKMFSLKILEKKNVHYVKGVP